MRPLGLMQAIGGMLPGYKGGQTTISSDYGIAQDPKAGGLAKMQVSIVEFNRPGEPV